MSTTTVLFRTTFTRTIKLNLLLNDSWVQTFDSYTYLGTIYRKHEPKKQSVALLDLEIDSLNHTNAKCSCCFVIRLKYLQPQIIFVSF